ncbi:hypothetical protein LDENG_00264130 [Lucifuga dentata]|nr:hypothetical protein LDENG_00264130 [Lucifuga dentata]
MARRQGIFFFNSMLWEMIVSNVTCMQIEYIRLKHAKWVVWFFKKKISHYTIPTYL